MKKLMFTAVAAMFGIVANAASASWSATGMAPLAEGASLVSVYAFDTKSMTQDAFLAAWKPGNTDPEQGTTWLSSATVGTIVPDTISIGEVAGYENGDPVNMWIAFLDSTKKNVLISDTASDFIGIQGQDPQLFWDMSTASAKGIFEAGAGAFAANGAGWYTTTPEPTSGLLLLLGLGVMALRRKRA